MLRLEISDEAEQDLVDIWKYIAEDSPVNAVRFLRKLADKYHWLTEHSEAGLKRDELLPGLCVYPYAKYMVYYRVTGNTLELVRILHSSRDLNRIFN